MTDESVTDVAWAATHAAASTPMTGAAPSRVRTTVLPRPGDGSTDPGPRARYERLKPIAAGGMGEVDLVLDRDINRQVAVKRVLHAGSDAVGLLRHGWLFRVVLLGLIAAVIYAVARTR